MSSRLPETVEHMHTFAFRLQSLKVSLIEKHQKESEFRLQHQTFYWCFWDMAGMTLITEQLQVNPCFHGNQVDTVDVNVFSSLKLVSGEHVDELYNQCHMFCFSTSFMPHLHLLSQMRFGATSWSLAEQLDRRWRAFGCRKTSLTFPKKKKSVFVLCCMNLLQRGAALCSTFFTQDMLTCRSGRSAGVNHQINDEWIPLSCSGFGSCLPRHCHRFPTPTAQSAHCETGLFASKATYSASLWL